MTERSEILATRDRIAQEAEGWPAQAKALRIVGDDSYKRAGLMLLGIKALERQANDLFDPVIEDANRAHKSAIAAKRTVIEPLKEAEKILKVGMGNYSVELEEKRAAEERRLRALAAKHAAEERQARLAEAAKEGPRKLAEAVVAPQAPPAAVTVAKTAPKVGGVSTRMVWKARLVDVKALVLHIAANCEQKPGLLELVIVDMASLRGFAKETRGEIVLPGVEFYQEPIVSSR